MGKRKSAKQAVKKGEYKLPTEFDCPFCNFHQCVEVLLERKKKMGSIGCRVCGHSFSSQINHLTEPADLYCEWIDACERANEEEASRILSTKKSTLKQSRAKSSNSELTN